MNPKLTLSEMMELVLAFTALVWGILFLLPGNVFNPSSNIGLLSIYAQDWVYGILLVLCSLFLIIFPRGEYFSLRRGVHFTLWLFWAGITTVILVRFYRADTVSIGGWLFLSFPVAFAFLHALLYARLVKVR